MRHHARLVKEYGTVPRVEGNENQHTQVFTNLLVNAAQAGSSFETPGRRGRVLIIDDDIDVSMSMQRALRDQHDVTLAADGRQGLARIAAGEVYDVIFCDLMMPNVGGIDVYETLSATQPEQAKRIAFMTGGALSTRSEEFLGRTGSPFLAKPFTLDQIRQIIGNYLK